MADGSWMEQRTRWLASRCDYPVRPDTSKRTEDRAGRPIDHDADPLACPASPRFGAGAQDEIDREPDEQEREFQQKQLQRRRGSVRRDELGQERGIEEDDLGVGEVVP